jgi:hypothetical protein
MRKRSSTMSIVVTVKEKERMNARAKTLTLLCGSE